MLESKCTQYDLPSFYELSAHNQGRPPKYLGLWKQNLLVKRNGLLPLTLKYANDAQVAIILKKLQTLDGIDIKREMLKELLHNSYICFLRLNCPIEDGIWHSQKMKNLICLGGIREVNALCESFMTLYISKSDSLLFRKRSDWETKFWLLRKAIKTCNGLFPNVALYISKRKKKKKPDSDKVNTNATKVTESKDKRNEAPSIVPMKQP